MRHDLIGGRALGGVDRPHPPKPDMAIGEAGEAEGFLLPILALDRAPDPRGKCSRYG